MFKPSFFYKFTLIILCFSSYNAYSQISGSVWKDLSRNGSLINQYGIQEINEPGLAGITVTLYPGGITTTTATDGTYSFPTASGLARVEFSNWPSHLEESVDAGANNTSIQFTSAPDTNIGLGLYSAKEYVNSDPIVASAILRAGGHATAPNETSASVATWQVGWGPTTAVGSTLAANQVDEMNNPATPTTLAQKQNVGSVYGMVFDKKRNRLYASAILKAHSDFGPAGADAIYSIPVNPTNGTQTSAVTTLINIPSADLLGAHVRTDIGSQNYDDTVLGLVGKTSFGDMDISEDYNFLYIMNLATRQVHEIDLNTSSISRTFDVPLVDGEIGGNCPSTEDIRPFGMAVKGNELFIGSVCTNESQAFDARYRSDGFTTNYFSNHPRWQMRAYVYSQDLSLITPSFDKVLDWDLDGRDHTAVPPNNDADDNYISHSANKGGRGGWMPWESTWAEMAQSINAELTSFGQGPFTNVSNFNFGTPLLSDIVFFGEDMTIAFRDRTADQWGPGTFSDLQMPAAVKQVISKGDIYLVYKDDAGNYQFEDGINGGARTSTVCTVNAGGFRNYCETCAGSSPAIAPDIRKGGVEWYHSDGTSSCTTPPHQGGGHRENIFGGLSQISGGSLITTQMNPPIPVGQNITSTGGVVYIDQSNGDPQREYMLYHGSTVDGLSKANGIGDVEVLSFTPIEVGNYIWLDSNSNGIQDPDESGIPNISIELLDNMNNVLSIAITDINGNYIFSNDPEGTDTVSRKYGISALSNLTELNIRISNISGVSQQPALLGLMLTSSNVGEGSNSNLNDSDGIISLAINAIINITNTEISNIGANTHSFDFGFGPLPSLDWGDAPDPTYPTLSASAGASHTLGSAVYLGVCVDSESDGQQSIGANGDDLAMSSNVFGACVGTDDEDGVTFISTLIPGNNADLTVTANSACTLSAWIDFNGDGDWLDAGEDLFPGGQALAAGINALNYAVPVSATNGNNYARFRCTTDGAVGFTGLASDGEVEDYLVTITPILTLGDFVWYDNNQNGIQDPGEPGVNGVTATLFSDANCTAGNEFGAPEVTTNGGMPANDGFYQFTNLPPGTYCVAFTGLPVGWAITLQNQGSDNQNSDANTNTALIENISLTSDDPDEDMGIYAAIGTVQGNMYCDFVPENGMYDAGEELENITINLYRDINCDGVGDFIYESQDTDANGNYLFNNLPVALSPTPPNPELCYIVGFDLTDDDLGSCFTPFLPISEPIELSTDDPDATPIVFGTILPPRIPLNNFWAILTLIGFILVYAKKKTQSMK